MTRRDDPHRDRADELDRALEALLRGDHSGLDQLPSELAATVDRLFWLSDESGQELESFGTTSRPEHVTRAGRKPVSGPIPAETPGRPLVAPVSKRTLKEISAVEGREGAEVPVSKSRKHLSMFMRVAAILVVVVLAAGALYALVPMLHDAGQDHGGAPHSEELPFGSLAPERCTVAASVVVTREYALNVLADVDVERDAALRRRIHFTPTTIHSETTDELKEVTWTWQACRRFGRTYEAMTLQSEYFTREDFYGERTLGFRGPVETAYSFATLNEMLDRREELDATSRRYWETAGYLPSVAEMLFLDGETFATDGAEFIAVRARAWNMDAGDWQDTPTIVVFQLVDGEYKLFDIQSTPVGTPPYL